MEKPETVGDPKAKADREKFEKVKKVPIDPLVTRRSKDTKLEVPKLKSPDELNPKWKPDPEEALAARKAKTKAKRDPQKEE